MVLALRLYSGPAFKPINDFLRQLSELHGPARIAVAQDPQLTFASTIGHLCVAIRRLAAVASPEEVSRTLWRGLRGELPTSFWEPDDLGDVCVVDVGEIKPCCSEPSDVSSERHKQSLVYHYSHSHIDLHRLYVDQL